MSQQEIDKSQVVLGMRDERLATVVHIWKIPADDKQLQEDLELLLELKRKELRYLAVDLEGYFTVIDLLKEGDASIEYHVRRALPLANGQLYRQIVRAITSIQDRLEQAAPPVMIEEKIYGSVQASLSPGSDREVRHSSLPVQPQTG